MPTFAVEPLAQVAAGVLTAAGAPKDIAQKIAGWLVNANLSGHPSHGVIRVPQYVSAIKDGSYRPAERPHVLRETDTAVLIDGRLGFGHLAAEAVTRATAAKAHQQGVAIGGITRCNHIGRLGEWSELAIDLNVVFFMATGGPGSMVAAPFGGAQGRLSTNPITFGARAGDDAMMLDFATTASAEGKIRVARDKGVPIPPGQILDKHGKPSTNPQDLYDGGVMLPFGGHKGYGLSLMAELLGNNLTGAVEPQPSGRLGTFALAIDPNAFGAGAAFVETTRATFRRMRETKAADGFREVLIPGDLERRSRQAMRASGVELPEATWDAVLKTAADLGLDAAALGRRAAGG
ncbi:MAG: Ldh family oxidoreductase [Actinobacteria bacterium]|nr:Ldh family oxidoreductase [Actinomycetota bacterium]